jgi:disulfide bond formation protein DsbB
MERMKTATYLIIIGGALTIGGAWFFQFVLGYEPCPLCLDQRIAYYVSIPLAVLIALGAEYGASPKVLTLALIAIAAAMIFNAGLGVYHSGVEWKWWAGPSDCSGPLNSLGSAGGLLKKLDEIHIARCDDAAWRFLGLSLAGYNAIISAALGLIALYGATRAFRLPARAD